jgi:hypothetical protein
VAFFFVAFLVAFFLVDRLVVLRAAFLVAAFRLVDLAAVLRAAFLVAIGSGSSIG